jgi:TetR/AcrR family transcriptional repressor of nem operon
VRNGVQVEAQAFMSTIHGAMLTARAFGDAEVFASITRGAIKQLTVPA